MKTDRQDPLKSDSEVVGNSLKTSRGDKMLPVEDYRAEYRGLILLQTRLATPDFIAGWFSMSGERGQKTLLSA